ncbi:MAG: copper chaperone PCu(A)C [Chloroflexota bacterium]
MRKLFFAGLLIPVLVLVGCRAEAVATAEDIVIAVAVDNEMPAMGEMALLVTVTDTDGNPIDDATVTVRGDMTHPGMNPVLPESVSESTDGVYTVPFEFTMGGDWIITVDVELPNGEIATATVNIDGVEGTMPEDMDGMDMSDDDMGDMDMSDDEMGDMDMGMSAVSGAYFVITNNRDADITLVSATAENIGIIEIHETIVDDNDMASMQEIEEGLIVPAGETVELRPGGLHLMLMQVEADLVQGETISITLTFDDDTMITYDAPIATTAVEDVEPVSLDDIEVTAYWARPVVANPMGDMDMDDEDSEAEATEESE